MMRSNFSRKFGYNSMRKLCLLLTLFLIFTSIGMAKPTSSNSSTQSISTESFLFLCINGTAEQVAQAIKAGADINPNVTYYINPNNKADSYWFHNDSYYGSPLSIACIYKNVDIVKILLATGAKVNVHGYYGATALMHASSTLGLLKNGILSKDLLDNQAEIVKALLDAKADVNIVDKFGITALLKAIQSENSNCVRMLLKAGADINVKLPQYFKLDDRNAFYHIYDRHYPSLLAVACLYKNVDIVKMLLAAGADINARDLYNTTTLIYALAPFPELYKIMPSKDFLGAQTEIVKTLIDAKVDVNITDIYGITALLEAAKSQNLDCVRMLLKAGADVNAKIKIPHFLKLNNKNSFYNKFYSSPLSVACLNKNVNIVKILLAAGADVNARDLYNTTALIYATAPLEHGTTSKNILEAQTEIVKMLLEAKADVNSVDMDGITALLQATKSKNSDCIQMLLKAGANVNSNITYHIKSKNTFSPPYAVYERPYSYKNPLSSACTSKKIDTVKILLAAGADVNARDLFNTTALIYATAPLGRGVTPKNILDAQTEIVKMLLEAKADVNSADMYGMTALLQATKSQNLDCIQLLLKAGAGVNPKSLYAINTKDKGASYDIYDRPYNSPLSAACLSKNVSIVKILLAAGANVNTHDLLDTTALIYATVPLKHGTTPKNVLDAQTEIVKMLLEAKADVNSVDMYGITALLEATESQNLDFIQILLKAGAEVNPKSSYSIDLKDKGASYNIYNRPYNSPLSAACLSKNVSIVKILLAAGADVNTRDLLNTTALIYATTILNYYPNTIPSKDILDAQTDIVKMLLEAKADVNSTDMYGMTALLQATKSKNLDCIQILLKAGANVNTANIYGDTPLRITAGFKFSKAWEPDTPLKIAEYAKNTMRMKILLKAGANVNYYIPINTDFHSTMRKKLTTLEYAILAGNPEALKILLNAGANVSLPMHEGLIHFAMQFASSSNSKILISILKDLLAHGADVNAYNNGYTISKNTYPMSIELLCSWWSGMQNLKPNLWKSSDVINIIDLLSKAGMNLKEKGEYNKTACEYLKFDEFGNTYNYIREKDALGRTILSEVCK